MLLCVLCFFFIFADEENELHHQEAEIELQRQRKRDEYHTWCSDKTKCDEELINPAILQLQLKAAKRQKIKRDAELKAISDARKALKIAEQVQKLREENKELLRRARKWFKQSGITKIFSAWRDYTKDILEFRATARCNGRQSKGGCCCWHCWPWSCRCCCCSVPQPAKKKKKLKLKKIKRPKKSTRRVQSYEVGEGKD